MEPLSLQLQGHASPPAQSAFQSPREVTVARKTTSQDPCPSSGSEESRGKHVPAQIKPMFVISNPEFPVNPAQGEMGQSTIHSNYNYSDPYFSGLFTAYGPQPFPQMVGIAPARVPLPLDLAEDGPIYVNAKQYHGILRRRQIRAKLEAQNKLVKTRRPYLHESRHLHAVNRVRGSGGRFLSTKKLRESLSMNCGSGSDSAKHHRASTASSTPHGMSQGVHGNVIFQPPDHHRLSSLPSHMAAAAASMQGGGGLTCNAYSPGVR
ncbi:PREDICTED: nuclear transcription factor Y subunit A-7-like isoform X1 [Ipomoea nil]|uniref:nuclear transcription factor Y subunit A-7-like isoform X1 n=1 Tax=Ipomoea nil TaxID=35883 RepID=UPI000900FF40|nr:PREDICTED: nuclear transcription factor Y subunit A-7-like isoform X1 [Ipomoea nil]XP_019191957.1 PREDICTED: nuclear transcription factor Y subunit A-7-like isoform X1 [Ipomoea nil]XP_019191958.1 PREDICTED: nuclear transcription factor Y subunit A-7-like isoform X1 [Ipomoea nil]